jgi:hypothetical protein
MTEPGSGLRFVPEGTTARGAAARVPPETEHLETEHLETEHLETGRPQPEHRRDVK